MRRVHRNLLLVVVVLAGAWLFIRSRTQPALPWNVGQAGSIFQPGARMGGGQ